MPVRSLGIGTGNAKLADTASLASSLAGRLQVALPSFFLQDERNFLRSLPCKPLALAWSEHSLETVDFSVVDFAIGVGLAAGAAFAAGAGADFAAGAGAGAAGVCANAGPATSASVRAEAVRNDENFMACDLVDAEPALVKRSS